jgi:tungstate transport system substrate-binding protein
MLSTAAGYRGVPTRGHVETTPRQNLGIALRVRTVLTNRAAIVRLACLAVLVQFALSPPMSSADGSNTLTVVGTSDVQDSGLFDNVLKPGFEAFYNKAHPTAPITISYLPKGTQAAITAAEAGSASALLVHAASLENQFVHDGFSAEPFGRAIFYGDFVLLGPASDPAHVMTNDKNNVAGAFQDIAAAGALGKANFVTRNDNSGTNVEEHLIWKQTNVPGCTVSDANGGGKTPSTTSGRCPTTATPPSWYQIGGTNQAANVQITDTCNFTGGPNDCYTITDRGTFDNLEALHELNRLHVLNGPNSGSAPGGTTFLVNSFHAYAINPKKFTGQPVSFNLPGAEAFLNWVTSPAGQTMVNDYLKGATGGPPFLKDAAPTLNITSKLPKSIAANRRLKVEGTLRNVVPGTPSLVKKKVTLSALRLSVARANPAAVPVPVATTTTGRHGHYVLRYRPQAHSRYFVSTGRITQIEKGSLNPKFRDLLNPTSQKLGVSRVRGSVAIHKVTVHGNRITVHGSLGPAPIDAFAQVRLLAAHVGHHPLNTVASRHVNAGKRNFVLHFRLSHRFTWRIRLRYVNGGQIKGANSRSANVN